MCRRLAHDSDVGAAMTGYTTGRDPLVAHRPCRKGRRALMAGLARGSGWDMPRCWFAHDPGGCTIMTTRGRTTARDACVIKCGPGKRRGGLVTALTGSGSYNVRCGFGHDTAIATAMTGHAAGRDPLMIHRRPRPKGR